MNFKDYTIFLDRDGVINHEEREQYINRLEDFIYYENAVNAISELSNMFGNLFIVTNQKGIAKGLTPVSVVEAIHQKIKKDVADAGGKISQIFYCADMSNDSPSRKPNPGMAIQAAKNFESVHLEKSIMAGNTLSDMHFGRNIGSFNIFIKSTRPEVDLQETSIDAHFYSLSEAAKWLSTEDAKQVINDAKTIR